MDHGLKKVTAAAILVGGVALALVFRHQPPEAETRIPGALDQLVLRANPAPVEPAAAPPQPPAPPLAASHPAPPAPALASPPVAPPPSPQLPQEISRPWATSKPISPGDPPPRLDRTFPPSVRPAPALPATSQKRQPARTHEVIDGDTLAGLAKRYLGSADRSREIYEANRAVLKDPDLLPIGVELVIPPRKAEHPPQVPPPASATPPPLVPVDSLPVAPIAP